MKLLRRLADTSMRVARAAQINIDTLAAMSRFAAGLAASTTSAAGETADLKSFLCMSARAQEGHAAHIRTASSLVVQAQAVIDQVSQPIPVVAQDILPKSK